MSQLSLKCKLHTLRRRHEIPKTISGIPLPRKEHDNISRASESLRIMPLVRMYRQRFFWSFSKLFDRCSHILLVEQVDYIVVVVSRLLSLKCPVSHPFAIITTIGVAREFIPMSLENVNEPRSLTCRRRCCICHAHRVSSTRARHLEIQAGLSLIDIHVLLSHWN